MSIQAYDADMVEAPGVETLAAGAVANLWASLGAVWPLWSALTLVFAIAAAAAEGLAGVAQAPMLIAADLAAALVGGIAIRVLLGRGPAAWKPDAGLAAFVLIAGLFAVGPTVLMLLAQPPAHTGSQAELSAYTTQAGGAAVVALAILWAAMRITPWPIGRLIGNDQMTPGRAWRLMRGVVPRYAMAAILLAAPVAVLAVMVAMLTKSQGHLISQIAVTPLSSLVALLVAAVAAEVYRSRIVVAPST